MDPIPKEEVGLAGKTESSDKVTSFVPNNIGVKFLFLMIIKSGRGGRVV